MSRIGSPEVVSVVILIGAVALILIGVINRELSTGFRALFIGLGLVLVAIVVVARFVVK